MFIKKQDDIAMDLVVLSQLQRSLDTSIMTSDREKSIIELHHRRVLPVPLIDQERRDDQKEKEERRS